MNKALACIIVSIICISCRQVDVMDDDSHASSSTATVSSSASTTGAGGASEVELTVTLSANTLQGKAIFHDTEALAAVTVNFTASPMHDAPIDDICFVRAGAGAFSEIVGARFRNPTTGDVEAALHPATETLCVTGLGLTIPAGTLEVGELLVDFDGMVGSQHRFGINDASSVTLSDGGLVDGVFPVLGNTFTISGASLGQLTTTMGDPVGPSYMACSADPAPLEVLLHFSLEVSAPDDLEIKRLEFVLESTDGGRVMGTGGTPYFTSLRVKSVSSGVTAMGPTELGVPAGAMQATISLADSFDQLKGSTKQYQFTARLSACMEDAPGELFGHHYRIVKKPFAVGDVVDLVFGEPLPTSHMPPQSDIIGNGFEVVAP